MQRAETRARGLVSAEERLQEHDLAVAVPEGRWTPEGWKGCLSSLVPHATMGALVLGSADDALDEQPGCNVPQQDREGYSVLGRACRRLR